MNLTSTPLAGAIRIIQTSLDDPARIVGRLNDAYIQAYLDADASAFDELLTDDFMVTLSNGMTLGKAPFLQLMAQPSGVSGHQVKDLVIRMIRDAAVVTATTVFVREDGTRGETRYTDIYVRRHGTWRVVAAHLTPVAPRL